MSARSGAWPRSKPAPLTTSSAEASADSAAFPKANVNRLRARYGSGSAAAKAGRQQLFENPAGLDFLTLNTSRPLFASARMRRAVNFAIDRTALARLGFFNNPPPFEPTDQYLPPGMPGFKDAHIYPFRPDIATARRLAGPGKHGTAVLYTCNVTPCPEQAQLIKDNLRAIGIDVDVHQFDWGVVTTKVRKPGEPFDLTPSWTVFAYVDPSAVLNAFLDSNVANLDSNWARFDDPAYNRKLEAAAILAGPARYLAYADLDADLARNAAPWVAWGVPPWREFFSPRIGCQVFDPSVPNMDIAALCLRK